MEVAASCVAVSWRGGGCWGRGVEALRGAEAGRDAVAPQGKCWCGCVCRHKRRGGVETRDVIGMVEPPSRCHGKNDEGGELLLFMQQEGRQGVPPGPRQPSEKEKGENDVGSARRIMLPQARQRVGSETKGAAAHKGGASHERPARCGERVRWGTTRQVGVSSVLDFESSSWTAGHHPGADACGAPRAKGKGCRSQSILVGNGAARAPARPGESAGMLWSGGAAGGGGDLWGRRKTTKAPPWLVQGKGMPA